MNTNYKFAGRRYKTTSVKQIFCSMKRSAEKPNQVGEQD